MAKSKTQQIIDAKLTVTFSSSGHYKILGYVGRGNQNRHSYTETSMMTIDDYKSSNDRKSLAAAYSLLQKLKRDYAKNK